jgi:hypothetical protein
LLWLKLSLTLISFKKLSIMTFRFKCYKEVMVGPWMFGLSLDTFLFLLNFFFLVALRYKLSTLRLIDWYTQLLEPHLQPYLLWLFWRQKLALAIVWMTGVHHCTWLFVEMEGGSQELFSQGDLEPQSFQSQPPK